MRTVRRWLTELARLRRVERSYTGPIRQAEQDRAGAAELQSARDRTIQRPNGS